jgi:hypothetical protein
MNMKLQDALLCVECESLYAFASHCPQCGSQVCFPLGRAINRSSAAGSRVDSPAPWFDRSGTKSPGSPAGRVLALQASA